MAVQQGKVGLYSRPIGINLSHEDRQEAGCSVGVTFMVTRRGWVRGPVACGERDAWAAHPTQEELR